MDLNYEVQNRYMNIIPIVYVRFRVWFTTIPWTSRADSVLRRMMTFRALLA